MIVTDTHKVEMKRRRRQEEEEKDTHTHTHTTQRRRRSRRRLLETDLYVRRGASVRRPSTRAHTHITFSFSLCLLLPLFCCLFLLQPTLTQAGLLKVCVCVCVLCVYMCVCTYKYSHVCHVTIHHIQIENHTHTHTHTHRSAVLYPGHPPSLIYAPCGGRA